jgi:hypothetical protein
MKLTILACATALVLAAGMISGAKASGHRGGHHWRHSHLIIVGDGDRDAGPTYGARYYSRYYSLGPLGFTSVPPGHTYSGYGTPINAWSR